MPNRYSDIKQLSDVEGTQYQLNPFYPEIPMSEDDYYVRTNFTDRFDSLALQFYNDSSYWWVIASANPAYIGNVTVPPGVQLRIPADPATIVANYRDFNNNR